MYQRKDCIFSKRRKGGFSGTVPVIITEILCLVFAVIIGIVVL